VTRVHHRASGWSFDIAPVLSWGARYDPYERYLVARIRSGKHTTELFDPNSLFLGSVGEHDLQRVGLKPPKPTEAQMEAYRLAMAEENAKRAERARIWREEQAAKAAALEHERKMLAMRRARMAAASARQEMEWVQAEPLPPARSALSPQLGRRRASGNDIAIVVRLLSSWDDVVLVNAGCGLARIYKREIRRVERLWGGLDEITMTPEAATGLREV
jgi:hypothetical protein